jgi:hypothetical protein
VVIARIIGGLGNQLFQYASARCVAERNGTELKLDISGFQNYGLRQYGLDRFHITGRVATPDDFRRVLGSRYGAKSWLRRIASLTRWNTLNLLPRCAYVKERFYHFDQRISTIRKKDIYWSGYWQSEKYFSDIETTIRTELIPRDGLTEKSKEFAVLIENTESISIHVRRGDYVSDESNRAVMAQCGSSYYQRAVEYVAKRVKEPCLFVFSDDPDWVRENLLFDVPMTIVDRKGPERDYEDLRLMAMCKHNIIANSTFSWWGAWLNGNSGKIVVAPELWFKAGNYDTRDLIPSKWVKL